MNTKLLLTILLLLVSNYISAQTGSIKGVVKDVNTGETIIGANVRLEGTDKGAATGLDGDFEISNVPAGSHTLIVSFITYSTQKVSVQVSAGNSKVVEISLDEDISELASVTVTAVRETASDISLLRNIKESVQVVSGLSAESIKRTLDSDASQVVKRIPGVTVVQDRFIVIRGLNERYNTTQLHNINTPSMEPDVRSFSLDVVPSNIIDQILIYKSPSPELPGDFSGGMVKIFTKSIPEETSTTLDVSTGFRQGTSLKDFRAEERRSSHWTGWNDEVNNLPGNFPERLTGLSAAEIDQAGRSLPNNWRESNYNSGLDYKLGLTYTFRKDIGKKGMQIGNTTSIQYSNTKTIFNVENNAFEAYDFDTNEPKLRYAFQDVEYGQEITNGIVFNWAWKINDKNVIELKNLYQRLTTHDFIDRFGDQIAQGFKQNNFAFFNEYRGVYSGQLVGSHKLFDETGKLEWVGGYGMTFNELPDYRRYRKNVVDEETGESVLFIPRGQTPDFLGKFYSTMRENIYSGAINFEQKFNQNSNTGFKPMVKAGVYLENREREFDARNLGFSRSPNFNEGLIQSDIDELFQPENINSINGIRLGENFTTSNFYIATNELRAYYLSLNMPLGKFNLSGGVRVEDNKQELRSPDRFQPGTSTPPIDPVVIDQVDFLPSVTLAYNINQKMVLKGVYGKTLNRPEFREIAPFGFFDFVFDATIAGNSFLRNATIHNYDLRWEWYPSLTETVSFALFYKDFRDPIESLYGNFGSEQSTFLFANTESAYARGFEVDVRKSMANVIKSKFFSKVSLTANISVIDSQVTLGDSLSLLLRATDRPLQGQSNFIVNTGISYDDEITGLQVNLNYNVIGKRILLVGAGAIPDTYEMPRNVLDLSIRKSLTEKLSVKAGVKDILNQEFLLLQDGNEDGVFDRKNDQIFRRYKLGTQYSIGFTYEF
ncbi:carboxypeptidase-like regulatory domain-containing protein [Belliella sp. DSM 107340]|uniref:Carboxypeptidase-like regulatory domain-containing protein n=1 Tax=Belliella calami TaxID=2923436 RepID=A0ABS9UMZ3_9BACT|nr:TonB-dependent receptor [Belliella calami]MCH7397985.1 carboxypeptidase-like regulatory domain-containing protein [Belliella calami]